MKHLRKINEKFLHKWRTKEALISDVWGISEDDIFDALSDIEDEFDVEISCRFILRSPKDNDFELGRQLLDDEVIEGYAAGGFTSIINIIIETNSDVREVLSTTMDCIKNINGYVLSNIHKSNSRLNLEIKLTNEEILNNGYHTKPNNFFSPYTSDFKQKGYRVIINKLFEKDDKFYTKLPKGKARKMYSILFEKSYHQNLSMIDELAELKKSFQSSVSGINTIDDLIDISYDFEIETLFKINGDGDKIEGQKPNIKVIFSISAYES